ncbi:helix-turn-helix domain-containing protein [Salirhabdus sp. Marseille-P4669]|uniref:helix-turn-helix domain-containing protein n=1 Tax=Salirhabdus sp. Marseille-P4669 TaxID=2042310 RepID=UPI000C7AD163|nr:helix-turn-helix transcriptional regulator [Salirhabdus sp. Marseille-P4669]
MASSRWGLRIKAFRKLKGYTQTEFAKAIGYSVSIVGEVERGTRLPDETFIRRTSEVLNITQEELKPKD